MSTSTSRETLIEAQGLSAGYGKMAIVREIDIRVDAGEVVALFGANGAGKTTTLLALAGELTPMGGEVRFLGQPTTAPMHVRCRGGLGYVTEERSVIMDMSVADNLKLAAVPRSRACEYFPALEPIMKRRAGLCSGGEQQMVALARVLGRDPQVLLVDELSLGLAPIIVTNLLQTVRTAARERGIGVLLVEQHVRQALRIADRAYVMERGRIVLSGTAGEVVSQLDKIETAYLSGGVLSPMLSTDAIIGALALEDAGPDRWRATNVDGGPGVVFGGQLMAQALVAGLLGLDGMTAKTVHTVFARGARPDVGLDLAVQRVHAGRTFATTIVTISQGDRVCTTSTVLAHIDEPDVIRHGEPAPRAAGPDDEGGTGETGEAGEAGEAGWEVRVADRVDVNDPDAVGPAELDVWTRFAGAPDDPVLSQALLAFASDGFLIGTAMRPHAGVGQAQAHRTLSTGVISHTITFHEPFRAGEWLLLAHRSPYAGRGRTYGRADVFDPSGQLVASFVQDAMIRPMPAGEGQRL